MTVPFESAQSQSVTTPLVSLYFIHVSFQKFVLISKILQSEKYLLHVASRVVEVYVATL